MKLPPLLRPWASYLQLFPEEISVSMGPLLPRLSVFFGPFFQHTKRGLGEPEGYEGLSRKGSYERLLGSEWLFADEAPDEFLRRAIMSEHLFFELAQKVQMSDRRIVLLFDAGPSQWGSPRLVQLAILLLFAQRALQQNAIFQFGFVTSPTEPLLAEVSQQTIQHFLQARTWDVPKEEHMQVWHQQLDGQVAHADIWVVSASSVVKQDQRFSRVFMEEVYGSFEEKSLMGDPSDSSVESRANDIEQVSVQICLAGQSRFSKEVFLDLPARAPRFQVLKNPFFASTVVSEKTKRSGHPGTIADPASLCFTARSPRLVARRKEGGILVYPISVNEQKQSPPIAIVPPNGQPVIAVGWLRKKGYLVTRQERNLVVYQANHRGDMISEQVLAPTQVFGDCKDCFMSETSLPNEIQVLYFSHHDGAMQGAFVDEGKMMTWLRTQESSFGHVVHENVLATGQFTEECLFTTASHRSLRLCTLQGKVPHLLQEIDFAQMVLGAKVMYCLMPDGSMKSSRKFAYSMDVILASDGIDTSARDIWIFPEVPEVINQGTYKLSKVPVELSSADLVIGLFWNQAKWISKSLKEGAVFLVLEQERHRIVLTDGKERDCWVESAVPIRQVVISAAFLLMAYVTEDGGLHFSYLYDRKRNYSYPLHE